MDDNIAIVCNSKNPDLVEYFYCKIDVFKKSFNNQKLIILKNSSIKIEDTDQVYNTSYTTSAFFDKKVPLDFFKSFYIFGILIYKKIKVVHFTTAHISNLFLSVLLKPFNIKQVFTIHDLVPHPGKKSLFITLYNKVVIHLLSDEIISFSKKEIEKQKLKEKFVYFPLSGFDQHIDTPKTGDKTILFFGRMESYKGFANLLDLIEKANNEKLDYKFVLAGKGNIENIEKFKKYDNVKIINRFIADDEVEKLFREATFTILPYDSATQSGVTILSYSYATPVIAYDVGSLGEYIQDGRNGFLVKYKDNDAVIDILKKLENDEVIKLSEYIIEDFDKQFSKKACNTLYYNYYARILK